MRSFALWMELLRWRLARRRARLWWRDDDATGSAGGKDMAALDRLLKTSAATGAPLTLAVVPAGELGGLAFRVARASTVTVAQHGVDHINRREGPVAGEFPHDWSQARLREELRKGWARMAGLPWRTKVFMPPWNDVHPRLAAALAAEGYLALSAEGRLGAEPGDAPPRLDAHLDLLRWRGGARFRGEGRFLGKLAKELRRRRRSGRWEAPIGLLTHHMAHDEAAWAFLPRFLTWSRARAEFEWVSLSGLLEGCDPATPDAPARIAV